MTAGEREDINPGDRKQEEESLVDERVQQISVRLKEDGGVNGTYFTEWRKLQHNLSCHVPPPTKEHSWNSHTHHSLHYPHGLKTRSGGTPPERPHTPPPVNSSAFPEIIAHSQTYLCQLYLLLDLHDSSQH